MTAAHGSDPLRGIPLEALRGFEAAARLLNFTRAAEELHLTQSAVSREIRSLEERLRTRLFERAKSGLRLTHADASVPPRRRGDTGTRPHGRVPVFRARNSGSAGDSGGVQCAPTAVRLVEDPRVTRHVAVVMASVLCALLLGACLAVREEQPGEMLRPAMTSEPVPLARPQPRRGGCAGGLERAARRAYRK